jgi:hypothetical protein
MKQQGILLERVAVIGFGQVADLWQQASKGDGYSQEVMTSLLAWSESHRERVPKCIDCDRRMGPLDIAAYIVMHDDRGDVGVTSSICMCCGDKYDDPQELPAVMAKGMRRRGVKVIDLPEAGHA